MTTILVADGVQMSALTSPFVRVLEALDRIAVGGRAEVPGLPDALVIEAVHSWGMAVRSLSFPNRASKDQLLWGLRSRLGPTVHVRLRHEGGPQEYVEIRWDNAP